MAIRARYKGDGNEHHSDIPARDLTEEEYQALSVEQRALVRSSPLYEARTDREMEGPAKTPAAPKEGVTDGR